MFCITKVVITVRTHFAGEVSRSSPVYTVDKLLLFGGKHCFFAVSLTKSESEWARLQGFGDPSPLSPLYSNRGTGVAFLEATHSLSQLSVAVIANSCYKKYHNSVKPQFAHYVTS